MKKTLFLILAMTLIPYSAFAVDGVVLINQSTVLSAGGFPYLITQPGSYRLTGNLTVPSANISAIVVSTNDVTIDLNGFSIIGPTVCSGSPVTSCSPTGPGNGVTYGGGVINGNNVTIVNGTIRGMGNVGIAFGGGQSGVTVDKVHVISNGSAGISIEFAAVVTGSTALSNGLWGIQVVEGTVSGNTAEFNKSYGILADCPSSVVGNMANNNGSTNLFINGGTCVAANNAAP